MVQLLVAYEVRNEVINAFFHTARVQVVTSGALALSCTSCRHGTLNPLGIKIGQNFKLSPDHAMIFLFSVRLFQSDILRLAIEAPSLYLTSKVTSYQIDVRESSWCPNTVQYFGNKSSVSPQMLLMS